MTSHVSVSKMNELMQLTNEANNEIASIVKMVNTLQENINQKVDAQEASYNKTKSAIQEYLNKISKGIPIDEEALNVFLSDNSEYTAIISLSKQLDEKITLVEQVKDALKVKDFVESLSNSNNNQVANRNAGNDDDSDSINIDEDINNNRINSHYQPPTRSRRRRRPIEDDDESYTISERNNHNNRSSEEEDDDLYGNNNNEDENGKDTYPNIICKRKRRPLFFCNTSIKMDKYEVLSRNPLMNNPLLSEESSDFIISSITIDSTDKLQELIKEKEALMPLVLNDIQGYHCSRYLKENFDRLMHVRTLYYSYYDMLPNTPIMHYEYFAFDSKIIQSPSDFKFVKLVLVRKPGGKIQNVILGCANLFLSYLSRKDIDGHTLIKGELKVTFDTFQYYFLTGIKGFSHLSQVQIEVFLHRSELFEDYNEVIDKSNLKPEQLKRYSQMGERLRKLRTVDRKIKLLQKKQG